MRLPVAIACIEPYSFPAIVQERISYLILEKPVAPITHDRQAKRGCSSRLRAPHSRAR